MVPKTRAWTSLGWKGYYSVYHTYLKINTSSLVLPKIWSEFKSLLSSHSFFGLVAFSDVSIKSIKSRFINNYLFKSIEVVFLPCNLSVKKTELSG